MWGGKTARTLDHNNIVQFLTIGIFIHVTEMYKLHFYKLHRQVEDQLNVPEGT